jgi:hypothetical protein
LTFFSDSTMADIEKKTEVIYGEENTVKKTLHDFSFVKERIDNRIDSTGPSDIISTEPVRKAIIDLRNRGTKVRFITEITKENIHTVKN